MNEEKSLSVQIVESFTRAMVPPKLEQVDAWAERNVTLTNRQSQLSGPFRFKYTPYLRFIVNRYIDPRIQRIKLCFGTQSAKTTAMFLMMGYTIDLHPGPTMYMGPTQDFCKRVSKGRLQPFINDSPAIRRHKTGASHDFNVLEYTLDRMTFYFGWAGSESTQRSHPIRNVFKDEESLFERGSSATVDNRTKSYSNHKIVSASTPRTRKDAFWNTVGLKPKNDEATGEELWNVSAWEPDGTSTVWLFRVPCPHCRKRIGLEWKQMRWPKDMAIRDLPDHGWYECQDCGGKILDRHLPEMLARGKWEALNPGARWETFYLPSIYAPWDSCKFGEIAAVYLRAKISGDPENIADFVRSWLALPCDMDDLGSVLITAETLDAVSKLSPTTYSRNQIPEGVKVLFLGSDVRLEQVHYVVIGLGAASEVWVIAWGIVGNEHELKAWLRSTTFLHPSGKSMHVAAGAIDGRFKPKDIKEFCRGEPLMTVVLGEDEQVYTRTRVLEPHRVTLLDKDAKGKPLPGSARGYLLNTAYWKRMIYYRINRRDQSDPVRFHLPADRDAVFDRHMQSEHEVSRKSRGGKRVTRWVTRPGFAANHYLDCIVYALAIANVKRCMSLKPEQEVVTAAAAYEPRTAKKAAGNAPEPFIKRKINIRRR